MAYENSYKPTSRFNGFICWMNNKGAFEFTDDFD